MDTAYVKANGRIVVPLRCRRKFGIIPGTKVYFIERRNQIRFPPVTKEYIRSICGILKNTTLVTQELLNGRKKDKEHEEVKIDEET